MAKTILIASGKGGVGKSTLCVMLARALKKHGKSVVCFDYDTGLRNLDLLLDVQDNIIYNAVDYVEGNAKLDDIIVRSQDGISLLSTSQYAKQKDIANKDFNKIIKSLSKRFDYILVDAPAGIEKSVKNAIASVDDIIIVLTPDNISLRDAERLNYEVRRLSSIRPMLVVNKLNKKLVKKSYQHNPKELANILDVDLLGSIPEDIEVLQGINEGKLADFDSRAAIAIDNIACRLLGLDIDKGKASKSIFSIFRRNRC